MANQDLNTWVQNPKNYEDNLKLVMWNGKKVPVINMMCPICNSKKKQANLKEACMTDPDMLKEETQKLLHECHGWHDCKLAIKDNIVFHKACLLKILKKKKFDKYVKSGEILTE